MPRFEVDQEGTAGRTFSVEAPDADAARRMVDEDDGELEVIDFESGEWSTTRITEVPE